MSGFSLTSAEQNGSEGVVAELATRIDRHGPIRFDEFVDVALYHEGAGFFAAGGGAGRAGGDFLTSPEVGPLFGAVVARYLDARWRELGRPDPFVVVEAAAGRGALAIAVLAAAPECAPALRYVLVERSRELRERQGEHLALSHPAEVLGPERDPDAVPPQPPATAAGPLVSSLAGLPSQPVDGVVIANELLDNLPFRLLELTDDGWAEVRVAVQASAGSGGAGAPPRFVELLTPAAGSDAELAARLAPSARPGARLPVQDAAVEWLADALALVRAGSVLAFDYASTSADLAERPVGEWLRTYRTHARGVGPLEAPGSQDITCEVAVDQLAAVRAPAADDSQTDWLQRWGIAELVEEGRRVWAERAGAADLAAMRARSRVAEAEALTDPAGLGAFRVLEWQRVGVGP